MAAQGATHFSELWGDPLMKSQFTELEQAYYHIHRIGYRKMPKEMYLNWLFRSRGDTSRTAYRFEPSQPFKDHQYEVTVMTAGDGENHEFFDQEETARIGTVEINRLTGKIVKFIERDKEEMPDEAIGRMYDPIVGRFWQVDPHAENYLNISPYAFVANNPIIYIDPDGRDIVIWYKDENGKDASFRFTGDASNAPKNEFVRQVIGAWTYNVSNGGGDPSFNAATDESVMINIMATDINSHHDRFSGTVYWNPEAGSLTDENVVLSPATVLDHELDHGYQAQKNPSQYAQDENTNRTDGYTNNEEYRVITGSEQKTARANGEIKENQVTRGNHNGRTVATSSPTSTKVNRARTIELRKRMNSNKTFDIDY
jgi:RHS repeat-associated protein